MKIARFWYVFQGFECLLSIDRVAVNAAHYIIKIWGNL
jgi:hypothetical protein